jgi:hypothetical protein
MGATGDSLEEICSLGLCYGEFFQVLSTLFLLNLQMKPKTVPEIMSDLVKEYSVPESKQVCAYCKLKSGNMALILVF